MSQLAATTPHVGPNTIIQTLAALREHFEYAQVRALISATPIEVYLDTPPAALIPEHEFHLLVRRIVTHVDPEQCTAIMQRAGELTAEYVLTNAIPPFVCRIFARLPDWLALRLFLPALGRFAWVFAGSGSFAFASGQAAFVSIASPVLQADHALAQAICPYYQSAFTRIFRAMITPHIALRETACTAYGAGRCVYHIER